MSTNYENSTTHQPSPAQAKLQNKGAARPEGSSDLDEGQFANQDFHVIAKHNGWTMGSYENTDGTNGFILTNGQSMFHFDVNGNIVLATGEPGQSGCGGKLVIHAKNQHQVTDSAYIHVRGNDEETDKGYAGKDNKKAPAYSLYVEGDVAIESQGGNVGMKGDNITINSQNTLTLKGDSIDLIAADGSGKINMSAADINTDSTYIKHNVDGGFYIDGSGEFSVNQKNKPGASASINTIGSIQHIATGDYKLSSRGDMQIDSTTGHVLFQALKGGASLKTRGKYIEDITGAYKGVVRGKSLGKNNDAAYTLELGAGIGGSYKMETKSKVIIESKLQMEIAAMNLKVVSKGPVKVIGKPIFLN
tara:strand:- start:384 stop:1466 length:1083 start_codon:yes stop_codon:yes gene_type:complete